MLYRISKDMKKSRLRGSKLQVSGPRASECIAVFAALRRGDLGFRAGWGARFTVL